MSRGMGKPISTTARRDGSRSMTARAPRSPLSVRSSAKTDAAKRTGLPRPSAYRGAAMTFPGALIASISAGMTSARTPGWSPKAMRTASVPAGSALTPAATEDACPDSGAGLTAICTSSPASVRASASFSGPVTTSTRRIPASITPSTTCRITGLPRSSSRSLGRPIRRESPAASTIAAVTTCSKTCAPRTVIRGARWVRSGSLLGGRRLHGSLGEDSQQVLLVLDGALEVGLDVHALRRLLGRRLDRGGVGSLAAYGGLNSLGPGGLGARARDADTRLRDLASVHGHHGSDADHGEAGSRMRELGVGALHVCPSGRDADFRKNLILCQRSRQKPLEEIVSLDGALPLGSLSHQLEAQGYRGSRRVGGRISVGEAAADRSHVAHHRIADVPGDLRQKRAPGLQKSGGFDGVVRGHGTDDESAAFLLDPGQARDLAEVDEVLGLGETKLHRRQEAVTAGQELGVVFVLGQEVDCLLDRAGLVVLELGWIHGRLPYFFDLAAWTVFQTRSGVSGMVSMWSMPKPDRASTTALTTAGVEAIVPVSPAPLMPSGLTGVGVSVRPVSYIGSMSDLGSA